MADLLRRAHIKIFHHKIWIMRCDKPAQGGRMNPCWFKMLLRPIDDSKNTEDREKIEISKIQWLLWEHTTQTHTRTQIRVFVLNCRKQDLVTFNGKREKQINFFHSLSLALIHTLFSVCGWSLTFFSLHMKWSFNVGPFSALLKAKCCANSVFKLTQKSIL